MYIYNVNNECLRFTNIVLSQINSINSLLPSISNISM